MTSPLDITAIEKLFTQSNGVFHFARWGRPIAPVIFGVDDATLGAVKTVMTQVLAITGQVMVETDPEMGANFIWIFCADWAEVQNLPDIDKLLPHWAQTQIKLREQKSNSYRYIAYDGDGAIRFCALVIKIAGAYGQQPLPVIATTQILQSLCSFAPNKFAQDSPIALDHNGVCSIKPPYRAVLQAAYDPVLPAASADATLALRLKARVDIILARIENDT